MHFVYALLDPRDQSIRYIGMSRQPEKRLREHMKDTNHKQKHAWLKELKAQGLEPIVKIVEKAGKDRKQAFSRETYWIHHYLEQGALLFNVPHHERRSIKKYQQSKTG